MAAGVTKPYEIWWKIKDSVPAVSHDQHLLAAYMTEAERDEHLGRLNPGGNIEFKTVDYQPSKKEKKKRDAEVFPEVENEAPSLPESGKQTPNVQGSLF